MSKVQKLIDETLEYINDGLFSHLKIDKDEITVVGLGGHFHFKRTGDLQKDLNRVLYDLKENK